MAQYIDKDALVAEIERRKQKLLDHIICERDKEFACRTAHQLNRIIDFLDTLEVKEVDLEKELDRIWFDNKFGDMFDNSAVDFANVREICKHFFELGLKAQKGEEV